MKPTSRPAILTLGLLTCLTQAQENRPPLGGEQRPGGPRSNPLVATLDTNGNHNLDADELAKAAESLKQLDIDGDGQLSSGEYRGERPEGGRPGGTARGQRPVPPLMIALDPNKDEVIDADELANAPEALKSLDKDNNGKLTPGEMRPSRAGGGQGDAGDDERQGAPKRPTSGEREAPGGRPGPGKGGQPRPPMRK